MEFRRGRGITVANPPEFARKHGYGHREIIQMTGDLSQEPRAAR
jgi:hypothetical protein